MDLKELRNEIDQIDDALVRLFCQRMDVSARIADYKKENGLPIFVPSREAEKLQDVAEKAGPEMAVYTRVLYDLLFELSRGYQSQRNAAGSALYSSIRSAIDRTEKILPKDVCFACTAEHVQEAQMVGQKFFGTARALQLRDTEGVLAAVKAELCPYGIVLLEGSSRNLCDLLTENGLYIVRSFRAAPGRQYLCVSKRLEIYPGADHTRIRMTLSNQPGALYKVLSRLYTLGINAVGLESYPAGQPNWQAMFYFELETSVYSEEFVRLMCELEDLCQDFSYLGSYCEVV